MASICSSTPGPGTVCGGVRLDRQTFVLPSSFANATLTDIRLDGYGDYPTGAPFLAAVSVSSAAADAPGLAGRTVYLDVDHNGRFEPGEPSTVTDANGDFTFTGLAPGTYTVAEAPQLNWQQTSPATPTYTVTVGSGQTISALDFGNQQQVAANDQPEFTSTPATTATAGQLYRYDVQAQDSDGDSLAFSLVSPPTGMAIDPVSGTILWLPAANQVGTQSVQVRVQDSQGGSMLQSFTLTVAPSTSALTITSTPLLLATENAAYSYQITTADSSALTPAFTLVNAPAGMAIDSSSGLLTWTPTQQGTQPVTIQARDTAGNTAYQTYWLRVLGPNLPPTLSSTPLTTVVAGALYHYAVQASDGSDSFTFALVNGPAGMTLDANTGLLSWTPAAAAVGVYPVDIRITSDRGAVTDQTFTLTVAADTQPPSVAVLQNNSVVDVGQTVGFQVMATDDVSVAGESLTVNGQPINLVNGLAAFTPSAAGLYTIVATATDASGNVGTASAQLRVIDPSDTTSPTVEITSLESGDTISYLTQITGTISDPYFDYYRIDYAPAGSNDWTLLTQSSTPVINGVLGTFDPTLLQNGPYTIRITAQNVNGLQTIREINVNLTGQAKIGNFREQFTDLQVPLAGIPITITRTYDTLQANQLGDFGYGWSLSLGDPHIFETVPVTDSPGDPFGATPFRAGTKVYLTNADGVREGFAFTPTAQAGLLGTIWHPEFTPDPGVYDTLRVNDVALEQYPDGTFRLYLVGFAYNPEDFTLTTKDGLSYRYDKFTSLQSVTDRNGNGLTVTVNGITSSTGQSIQFVRDAEGRITQIIDPAGHALTYTYDDNGNLATMTDQIGRMAHYSYLDNPAHYLSSVNEDTDGCSCQPATPPQIIHYGSDGRLSGIADGTGNSSTASYELNTDTETVADALGNLTTIVYDDQGNVIAQTDALGDTTRYQYDANNNNTAETDPLGNTTRWTYDAHGNITSVTDALGNTTSFTYNAFNKATRAVDAAGNAYQYVYDTHGNLVEIINPLGQTSSYTVDSEGRIVTVTDGNNNTTVYGYGVGPQPTQVTYPDPASDTVVYNDLGEPVQLVDENGHITTMVYNDAGQVVSITDPTGATIQYAYNGTLLVSQTDALGRTTTYQYDAANRLIAETDAAGGVWKTTYDADGRVIAQTDPLDHTTQTIYDAAGRVTAVIDALGNKTTYSYDAAGNRTSMTDANGHTTLYAYDADNRLIQITDALGGVTRYQYDALGNIISVTDANGHTTTMLYNALSELVKAIDPLGNVTTFQYDANGNEISETDANGNTTRWIYDSRNRVEKVVDAGIGITTYTYDGVGKKTSVTDAKGHTTTMTYDADNRLVSETDPTGATATWTYDAVGNALTETDPLGRVTTMTYDALDRMVSETDPTGATTKWSYDAVGNLLSETDPLGRTTSSTYDADDQLVSQTDPQGGVEKFTYDGVGNLLSETDAGGNTTTMQYDADNRLMTQTDPLHHTTQYGYDAVGNLTQEIDRNDGLRTFTYDADNRQTAETWWQNGTATYQANYTYDGVGNLLTASDNNSSYTYQYDTLDRVTSVDNTGTPNVPQVTLNYQYDAVGNVTQVQDNTGVVVPYAYDPRDLLTSQLWSGGDIAGVKVAYTYDAAGELTSLQRDANVNGSQLVSQTQYAYDAAGRVQTLTHEDASGTALVSYQYQYDASGRLAQESHHGHTYQYTYDANGQLTGVTEDGQTSASNSYDAAGNRTSNGNVVGTGNQILSDANCTYKYDNEGNLIQKTSLSDGSDWTYTYDYRNRLTSATETSAGSVVLHEVTYTYDVFNRRIVQSVDGVKTSFVYNGDQLWVQYDGSGSVLARYLYGQGQDQVLARWQPSTSTSWYLTDRLGTVRDILNYAGQIIDHIDYDAWGRVLSETNPSVGDGFKFTGQWYDAATGLYDYLNRWYDPQLQRFVSQDPLGWSSGQANPYGYVGNSPLNFVDPSGEVAIGYALLSRAPISAVGAEVGGILGYICGYWDAKLANGNDKLDAATVEANAEEAGREAARWGALAGGAFALTGSLPFWKEVWQGIGYVISVVGVASTAKWLSTPDNGYQYALRVGCTAGGFVSGWGINKLVGYLFPKMPAGARPGSQGQPSAVKSSAGSRTAEQLAIRQRVLANIAKSAAARASSNFDIHAGLERINRIRLQFAVSGRKNLAFADFEINGTKGTQLGVSGSNSRPGFAPVPEEPLFGAFNVDWPRGYDAEALILEAIGSGNYPENATGTIHLFSERPICDSCLFVIDQFEVLFPNIKIIATSGPG